MSKRNAGPCKDRWPINLFRDILWVFFKVLYGTRWLYPERVPKSGPVILAPSHASFYDPLMVSVPVRRPTNYFTNDYYFGRLLGPVIRYLGAFPVNVDKRFDRKAYELALRTLENGGLLVLFPEGTRSHDGLLCPLRAGVASLAVETGATIVPVSLCGAFEAWPRTRPFPRFFKLISIKYHRPIHVQATTVRAERREKVAEINARLERALAPRLRAWNKALERKTKAKGPRTKDEGQTEIGE